MAGTRPAITKFPIPLLDPPAHGVYIIAATPFTEDGAVDTASLDRLMDFYLRAGITAGSVLGILGAAPQRSAAGRRRAVAGRGVDGRADQGRDECRRRWRDDRAAFHAQDRRPDRC